MLQTPSTGHVNSDLVYEPAEDSFLLLDTLSSASEVLFLTERFSHPANCGKSFGLPPAPLVLEVGTGSGVVIAFVTAHAKKIFGRRDILCLGTDINPFACQATGQTILKACEDSCDGSKDVSVHSDAAFSIATLNANLVSPIKPGMVDVLIFNPPYVPTDEVPTLCMDHDTAPTSGPNSELLALSYAGGIDGMEITDQLLEQLPTVLNQERGTAYLLLCKQNKPEKLVQRIRQWGPSWAISLVGQPGKTGGWERLQVFRIFRV